METTKRSIKYIQVKRVVFTPARQQWPLAPTLSHLSCNYPCSLRSLLFGFCQNWTFSNQIFWRQTIILLPLSSFHWIGDKPFPRQDPRLGWAGRGGERGQARLPINHHLECFTELYAVINPEPEPGHPAPPPPSQTKNPPKRPNTRLREKWPEKIRSPPPSGEPSYDSPHMVYWPRRLGQWGSVMNGLLLFKNKVRSDWVLR